MKKQITFVVFTTLLFASLSMSFKRDPKNPPVANTGAPGEQTCQNSNCHSGGTYTGEVAITGIPDSIVANETYTVVLTSTSTGPTRGGFQMTALDAKANAGIGTFSVGTGSSIGTSGTKQYIRQSTAATYSGGKVSWTFKWKAPAAKVDSIRFYYVTLCGNGNGKESGDNVLKGNKKVVFKKTTAIQELQSDNNLVKMPSAAVQGVLSIQLAENEGQLWIYDTEGRMMQNQALTTDNQVDVNGLLRGMYIAVIKIGNQTVSKRFLK